MARRVVRLLVAAGLLAPLVLTVPGSAAAGGAPCDVIDFSPSFVTDHTAVCAHQTVTYEQGLVPELSTFHVGVIEVWATTDSGRSWHKQASTGLPPAEDSETAETLNTVLFSPNYTTDRIVYCYVGGYGLYASTDLGASWQWLDALLLGPGPVNHNALTPFTVVSPGADSGSAPGGFAYAYGAGITLSGEAAPINSLLLPPPVQTQVQGGPGLTEHFLMPQKWPQVPAMAVTYTAADDSATGVYGCDAALRCTTRLFNAGAQGYVDRAWLAPDYLDSATAYVVTHRFDAHRARTSVYRSTDAGAHWSVWQPVQRLVSPLDTVSLGFDPAHPRTMYLRVSNDGGREALYVSADGGAHWARRAGRAPYDRPWGWGYQRAGLWPRGSRLFTLGARVAGRQPNGFQRYSDTGVYCSVDGGRTWARSCAR
jgi:hypothetical protein